MTATKKTARFWTWHHDDWIRLSLQDGESISTYEGGPTEEGYCYTWHTYERDGDVVTCSMVEESRDCDGRLDRSWNGECPLSRLQSQGGRPDWTEVGRGQRDHSAEAMGY